MTSQALKNLRDVAKRYDVLSNVVFRDASLYNLSFKLETGKCFCAKVIIVNVKKGIAFKTCALKLFCVKDKDFLNFLFSVLKLGFCCGFVVLTTQSTLS